MIAPPKTISQLLDLHSEVMLERLAVIASQMQATENILLHASASDINNVLQSQGDAMDAKLTAFAVLGRAINQVFELQGQPKPLDTSSFADKLNAHGKSLTAQGVIDTPQPEPQPE